MIARVDVKYRFDINTPVRSFPIICAMGHDDKRGRKARSPMAASI